MPLNSGSLASLTSPQFTVMTAVGEALSRSSSWASILPAHIPRCRCLINASPLAKPLPLEKIRALEGGNQENGGPSLPWTLEWLCTRVDAYMASEIVLPYKGGIARRSKESA